MRRLAKRIVYVLIGLALVGALPVRAEPPAPGVPSEYRAFARTGRTRLTDVWGGREDSGTVTSVAFAPDGKLALSAKTPGPTDPVQETDAPDPPPKRQYGFTLWDATTLR